MKKIAFLLVIVIMLSCFVSCKNQSSEIVCKEDTHCDASYENQSSETVCEEEPAMTINVQITEINGDSVTADVINSSEEKTSDCISFTEPEGTTLFVNDTICITYVGRNTEGQLNITDIDIITSGDPGDTYFVDNNEENRAAGKNFTCVRVTLERIFDSFFIGKNFEEDDGITYVIDFNPELKTELLSTTAISIDIIFSGAIYDAPKKIVRATAENLQELPNPYIPDNPTTIACYKPVIYLYPTSTTKVSVKLTGPELTCTYPAYNDGWKITAQPDGTLTDESGKIYSYLYWEGLTDAEWDFSSGFCIEGCKTAEFLEEALEKLGLTRREANEFIVYWLPLMQDNQYNVISFQIDVYTEAAKLEISPAPDTLIRVFMTWYASDTEVEIPEQELTSPARDGFVAVEWGGTQVK